MVKNEFQMLEISKNPKNFSFFLSSTTQKVTQCVTKGGKFKKSLSTTLSRSYIVFALVGSFFGLKKRLTSAFWRTFE